MDASQQMELARHLREGLDAYGHDEVDAAISAWERALEIDPENADAKDYIEAAGRPTPVERPAVPVTVASDFALLEGALELAAAQQLEEAWALLEGGTAGQSLDAETVAVMDLVRSKLVPIYRERLSPTAVPKPGADPKALARFNLPADAGFLFSLCDGSTTVADLMALSGTDVFEALHNLNGLAAAGLVSVDA